MRPNRAGLWRVIYIARGERQAQQIEELLKQAGFLVDRKRYPADGAHPEDIEIKALIDDMLTTDAPPNCPHGRPIMKIFRKYEVERMFHRV